MTELSDKDKIIKSIYENIDTGYGSIKDTYQQVKKKDNSITIKDVRIYLNKLKHREVQFKYKGFNSFMSPHPLFEIELDLIDLTKKAEENDGYRYALVAIDNFTKYAWAVPMKTKKPSDLVNSFSEVLDKIGIPKQIYSDFEGAMQSDDFIMLLNKHKIKHITTIAGAHGVERFNRTLKTNIQIRLDAMGLDRYKWLEQLKPVINKYNNTSHSTIGMSPNEARKRSNEMVVKWHLWNNSNRERKYPKLEKNDEVRVMLKKEAGKTKGYMPNWTLETYKVIAINGDDYLINDGKRRVYIRAELLKV